MRSGTTGKACDPKAAAELLRALAHPMRLAILCRLLDGEVAVSGFESELGLKQPSLSQQLGQLREAGLVSTRREAKSVFYSIANRRLEGVLDAVHSYFADEIMPTPQPAARRMALPPIPPAAPERSAKIPPSECGVFSVAGWPGQPGRGKRG
jgi:DNA-binding transcriptional ArsR family regulator